LRNVNTPIEWSTSENSLKLAAVSCKRALFEYRHAMLRPPYFVLVRSFAPRPRWPTRFNSRQPAISGKVLSEKRDSVAGLGYTVLVVPRASITRLFAATTPKITKPAVASKPARNPLPRPCLSNTPTSITPPRSPPRAQRCANCQQLAKPSCRWHARRLGSGFFINDDGFLMTNFHVIESETQISSRFTSSATASSRQDLQAMRIVAINKFADLALLRIEDKDARSSARDLRHSHDALSVGDASSPSQSARLTDGDGGNPQHEDAPVQASCICRHGAN